MRTRLLIAGPLAMLVTLFFAASAMAGIRLTVNTTADPTIPITPDGQCSLREAIGASNTSTTVGTADCPSTGTPPETQIGFDPVLGASPVVNLNLANPSLTFLNNDVTVTGPATVTGATNSGFRVITSSGINLTLTSLTITNGSENVEGLGGGIRAIGPGSLTLNNSTVSQNKATRTSTSGASVQGGGIYSSARVTLNDSTVSNNQAIATYTGGLAGTALALGGGVEANGTDLTMENSVASGNKATASANGSGGAEADGGGVRSDGDVVIEHSTVSGNLISATSTGTGQPAVQGGGMLFHGASSNVRVELSTIANNLMKAPASTTPALQKGGGIEDYAANIAGYLSDTIAGNGLDPLSQTAGVQGLNFQSTGAGVIGRFFANTIVANPVGLSGSNCDGDTPYPDDGAPDLEFQESVPASCFGAGLNIMHADPQLGALGDNGGATPTMVPAPTSPVIDQGTASYQTDPDTANQDQRGLTRPLVFTGLAHPFGGGDIGAVEVQQACSGFTQPTPTTACPSPPSPPATPPTTPPTTKKKCKKHKKGKKAAAAKCKKKKGKK